MDPAAEQKAGQEQANGVTAHEPKDTKTAVEEGDNYAIHDAKTLQEAGELKIKDESGKEVAFKSLYEVQPGRQLIVFIRHFFCGVCYISFGLA